MKLPRRKFLQLAAGAAAVPGVSRTAWAEGNIRKVGIVSNGSVDAASRSPEFKRFTDAIRASVPDQSITFEFRSADGNNDRYPQIITDLVQQRVDVIFADQVPPL
jgi:ABC-type branched-subunit amino acid transport system substrate-binding protein